MKDVKETAKELKELGFVNDAAYLIVNEGTGQYYFGSTNDPIRRYKQHVNALRNGTHENSLLQEAYNNDPNFVYYVTPMDNRIDAHLYENVNIAEFHSDPNNLNIMPAVPVSYIERVIPLESKEVMGIAMKERWKDPVFREKMLAASRARWEDPEYRKKMAEVQEHIRSQPDYFEKTSERFKAQWTPELRAQQAARIKTLWSNEDTANDLRVKLSESWTEERKQKKSIDYKELWQDLELLQKNSDASKELWKDPEYRQRQTEIHADPEHRRKHSQATKEAMQRPDVKAKVQKTYRPVSVDGNIFPTLTEAARVTGMSPCAMFNRLNSTRPRYDTWFYVDNPKPICNLQPGA